MKRLRKRYLSEQDKRRLLSVLKLRKDAVRQYFMFRLMLLTGLRATETRNLNVGDVDRGKTKLTVNGKRQLIGEIPLKAELREHIVEYLAWKARQGESLDPDVPLFISQKRTRITVRQMQRDLDRWTRIAGIEGKYSPHSLRHTFGTEIQRKIKDIRVTQDLMRHKFITSTQIYTHVTDEQRNKAIELLGV
jgi:site-specific recombinase XerD